MTLTDLWRPLLGGVVILLLVAGEWLLRVRHRQSAMSAPAEGLRSYTRDIDPDALANYFRIVALGDSITHGMSLRREQTYPDILSKLWQPHCEQPVMMINAGIAGQTAVQGLQRVWRDVIRYRPHVTLVAFGLNDANLRRRRQDAFREREVAPAGMLALLNQLHIVRTCRTRVRQVAFSFGLSKPLDYNAAPWDEPRSSPHAFQKALSQLVKEVRKHSGGDVWLLTTHPVKQEDSPSDRDKRQNVILLEYNEIVRSVARELDAGLIDIEQIFSQKKLTNVLQADGVHLTEAGQHALAESIYEKLVTQVSHRER